MGITKAPGDRSADTPEWICITNQRINPFKSRDQEVIPRAQRKEYEVKSLYTGYICTTVAHDTYHVSVQTLRKWNREGYVRTLKQRHATMYLEADLQRLTARRTALKKPELKTMDYLFRQIALEKWARAGHGRCFTCGKVLVRDRLEVGHYKSRRHRSIRWSLDNARLQCHDCNQAQAGAHGAAKAREVEATYRARLVAEIGEERVQAVEDAARRLGNIDAPDVVELYETMKEAVRRLE